MKITVDPAKDAANLAKHGLSLRDAQYMDWSTALIWNDIRQDYGEPRKCALAVMIDRVMCIAFVDRKDGRRVISLRKANQRETDRYVTFIEKA